MMYMITCDQMVTIHVIRDKIYVESGEEIGNIKPNLRVDDFGGFSKTLMQLVTYSFDVFRCQLRGILRRWCVVWS